MGRKRTPSAMKKGIESRVEQINKKFYALLDWLGRVSDPMDKEHQQKLKRYLMTRVEDLDTKITEDRETKEPPKFSLDSGSKFSLGPGTQS